MDTWQMLTPHYMSEFFTIWYTQPFAKGILFVTLSLIFPLQLCLIALTKQADQKKGETWDKIKRHWFLILIHKATKTDQSKAYWIFYFVVWMLGIVYLYIHFQHLSKNPDILTTDSLQTLNNDDFEIARQFFQRWVALGWVLMLFLLTFFLNYLEKGFTRLKSTVSSNSGTFTPDANTNSDGAEIARDRTETAFTPVPDGEVYKPRLTISSYEKVPSNTERILYSILATPNTPVYLSKEGEISTSRETSALIVFQYTDVSQEQNLYQAGWRCFRKDKAPPSIYFDANKLESEQSIKLVDFHLLTWKVGQKKYWCKVTVR